MKYYKVICGSYVVDALDNIKWVRFIEEFSQNVITDKSSAHGFYGSDKKTIYVREGFSSPSYKHYKVGKLQQIGEQEYLELKKQLTGRKQLTAERAQLVEARKTKIAELSNQCSLRISQGVSVKLSDNKYHKFSLTVEDQLNIQSLYADILGGDASVVYHEDGKECQKFSAEDFIQIVKASRQHIKYHTTYFNILKNYIKKSRDAFEISSIIYGVDVLTLDTSAEARALMEECING